MKTESHAADYKKYGASNTLVVFIHGFMGSPVQFDFLAGAIYESGCSVLRILLPGHGATDKEFTRATLRDWREHVQNEIGRYQPEYETIILAAHSLGGLLALLAAANKKNKISGVFLLAPPLKLYYINPRSLYQKAKYLCLPKKHEIKKEYRRANSVKVTNILRFPLWLKPYSALRKAIKITKAALKDVRVPVVLIHSKKDETVSFKSAQLLKNGLTCACVRAVTLTHSWHAFYTKEERAEIKEELLGLIAQTHKP